MFRTHFVGLRGNTLTITAAATPAKIVCKMSFDHMNGNSQMLIFSEAIQKGCGPRQPKNPHSFHGTKLATQARPREAQAVFVSSR
jgi:hypothetical protein